MTTAITDILTHDEIRDLTRTSDLRCAWSVAVTWGVIAGAMALAAWRPNAVTAAVGVVPINQTGRTKLDVLKVGACNLAPVIATNLALAAILVALGHGWLYGLWVGAWMTTFSLIIRIRSMAEHACTEKTDDQYRNTRTTAANIVARLTVAPHHVNYHLEHHALMTAPHYRLRAMHRLLRERGVYEASPFSPGYWRIIRLVSAKAG